MPQNDIFVMPSLVKETAVQAPPCFGIVDCLFAAAAAKTEKSWENVPTRQENRARRDAAKNLIKPMLGHGFNDLFLQEFESALSSTVGASSWMHMSAPVVKTGAHASVQSAKNIGPLITITLRYYLDNDGRYLRIDADISLYRKGENQPYYRRNLTYSVRPTGGDTDSVAIKDWSENDFALLKSSIKEGVSQICSQLASDIGINVNSNRKRIYISNFLVNGGAEHGDAWNDLAVLVSSDLGHFGAFSVVDTKLSVDGIPVPRFDEWRSADIQILVTGDIENLADGRSKIEVRVWDIVNRTQLAGVTYTATAKHKSQVGHVISGMIYKQITGIDAQESP